jgi:hypothetical protein
MGKDFECERHLSRPHVRSIPEIESRCSPTWASTEGRHRLLSGPLRVQVPGLICLLVGLEATVQSDVILASYGLAIENEERDNFRLCPEIEVLVYVCFDPSKAAES